MRGYFNSAMKAVSFRCIDTDSEHCAKTLARIYESEPAAAVEGTRRRSHRFDCEVIFVPGRKDLRICVTFEEIHPDFACGRRDRE